MGVIFKVSITSVSRAVCMNSMNSDLQSVERSPDHPKTTSRNVSACHVPISAAPADAAWEASGSPHQGTRIVRIILGIFKGGY